MLVGGRSFHECEEVIAVRNALSAIEWPDDELSVFATLRGPFFASVTRPFSCSGRSSQRTAAQNAPAQSVRPLDRASMPSAKWRKWPTRSICCVELHVARNRRPIAQTITMLLDAVRVHAGIALWPSGEQALANTQRLIDMARQFERGASSFRAFVNKLEMDAERGEADEAPIVEEGTEGVRLMTVHKAKGLQFPVVILADPTCSAARDTPSRHVELRPPALA